MKALVLSDLHLSTEIFTNNWKRNRLKYTLNAIILEDYDIVLISGDVVESSIYKRKTATEIYDILYSIFEKDIVFCLGNHEFAYSDFTKVHEFWQTGKNHPHVHCLDIDGKFELNNITFTGNVFWYDFSLNENQLLMQGEIVDGWLDSTISNFDPIKENEKCQNQILQNLSKTNKNILITHMVPHKDLNTFSIETPFSAYNAYSGNKDFLKQLSDYNIEYALCGHTHRRECKDIYGIKCINLGNDYYFRTNTYEYMILDI